MTLTRAPTEPQTLFFFLFRTIMTWLCRPTIFSTFKPQKIFPTESYYGQRWEWQVFPLLTIYDLLKLRSRKDKISEKQILLAEQPSLYFVFFILNIYICYFILWILLSEVLLFGICYISPMKRHFHESNTVLNPIWWF